MTTKTTTLDGEHLEISTNGPSLHPLHRIRIESLDRNGTPNWGLTLTKDEALELADILEDYATDPFAAGIKADIAAKDAAKVEGPEAHLHPRNNPASDPFAGIVDLKTNDPWDGS